MSEPKYPNESQAYRDARQKLLAEEEALMAKVKAVAALRRALPLGGVVDQPYEFISANTATLGQTRTLHDLFADHSTLILYNYMYGPNWDKPCLSCTSLVDGFDRAAPSVSAHAAFVVVAKAPAEKFNTWAQSRGWDNLTLVSAAQTDFLQHYLAQGEEEDKLWPMMNVFTRREDGIYHFWASELADNHVDLVWPYWNLMDMTPQGRPDEFNPPMGFRSKFLEQNYSG